MSRLRLGDVFDVTIIECRSGFVSVLFEGQGAKRLFANEPGGHRWQRIPPTEKRGRVQTSTVTVAVLEPDKDDGFTLDSGDIRIFTTRGTGAGGQHKNKTDSCVVARHIPTGIEVRMDSRSQHQNRKQALDVLRDRVGEREHTKGVNKRAGQRRSQVGSGMRGDKVRTYREKDDRVVDHNTGGRYRLKAWLRGEW